MTSRLVVPTLAHVPSINQSLGPFWVASCESRVKEALAAARGKKPLWRLPSPPPGGSR
jgi:hypothetical protein